MAGSAGGAGSAGSGSEENHNPNPRSTLTADRAFVSAQQGTGYDDQMVWLSKSTLFNRLVGRKLALVDDQPGVTRDLREGDARLFDLRFTVIDTAGLEEVTDNSLQGRMRRLTERAVEMADACLFVIDGRVGVTPTDEVFADILRKKNARVFLAVNKAEGKAGDAGAIEAYSLGLGEPIRISAEHGEGMDDLYNALRPLEGEFAEREAENAPEVDIDLSEEDAELDADETAHHPTVKKPLQIAVIGRPNAGKSTLINKILGYDRLLTGPEAGITRDAISVRADWQGTPIRIWDTAGMRKKARVTEKRDPSLRARSAALRHRAARAKASICAPLVPVGNRQVAIAIMPLSTSVKRSAISGVAVPRATVRVMSVVASRYCPPLSTR